MSASPPPPRRSQRDKKAVKPFDSGIPLKSFVACAHPHAALAAASARKRKRGDNEDEDDAQHATDQDIHRLSDDPRDAGDEDEGDGDGDDAGGGEDEEEYRTPKAKPSGAGRKGKAKATPKAKPGAPVKKPRKTRTAKGATARGAAGMSQADQQAKDTNIAGDNVLFSKFPAPYFTRWHVHLTCRRCPCQRSCATSIHRRRLYRVAAPNTGRCTSRAGEPYSALLRVQRLCRR